MNQSQYIDLINEAEERFAVEEWTIGGTHVWPFIRIPSRFRLYRSESGRLPTNAEEGRVRDVVATAGRRVAAVIKAAHAYISDYRHDARPAAGADAVFLTHSTCRLFAVDGRMYDVFCDPLVAMLADLGHGSFIMEYAPKREYRLPRYGQSMFLDMPLTLRELRRLFRSRALDVSFAHEKEYAELGRFLRSRVDHIAFPSPADIRAHVSKLHLVADFFTDVLTKIRPSVGFVVDYYGTLGMAFNLACRECGVLSVDIQHGVQGELHPAYGRWLRLPSSGFELLPSVFWCWSENEVETILKWSTKSSGWHKPLLGGNAYLEMFRDTTNEVVRSFDRQVAAMTGRHNADLQVLVTLRPGSGLTELLRHTMVASPDSWFWWVRLHPAMLSEKKSISSAVRQLCPSRADSDAATELPLHSLLRHVDVHVTECSSTVIEAEHFGVPSVITHETGVLYYQRQIQSGLAATAYSPVDLIAAIRRQSAREKESGRRPADFDRKGATPAEAVRGLFQMAEERRCRQTLTM